MKWAYTLPILICCLLGVASFPASGLDTQELFDNGPWFATGFWVCLFSGGFIAGLFGIEKGPMGLVGLYVGQNLSLFWMIFVAPQGPVRSTASIAFGLALITTGIAGIAFVVGLGIRSVWLRFANEAE